MWNRSGLRWTLEPHPWGIPGVIGAVWPMHTALPALPTPSPNPKRPVGSPPAAPQDWKPTCRWSQRHHAPGQGWARVPCRQGVPAPWLLLLTPNKEESYREQ